MSEVKKAAKRQKQRTEKYRESQQRLEEQLEDIEKFNREMIARQKVQNEQIRELLRRAFTSKREGRDISPVVRQRLEALENVLSKREDRNQEVLKQIALALYDAELLTVDDIKNAKSAPKSKDTLFGTLARSITGRATKRGSSSATRGGRKTRKNRGKKQKTQKRRQHNKKRKQTQRRKQHKKK